MTVRRAAIGFQGGQVLSLQLSDEGLTELRKALSKRHRLARGRGDRRRRRARPHPGRLPARRVRRAPRRLLAPQCRPSASASTRSTSRSIGASAASRGRPTASAGCAATRAWASTARSGSPPGPPGSRSTAGGAAAGRARRAVSASPTASRPRSSWRSAGSVPRSRTCPHLMATPTGLSFPSSHATSSFAAARAFGTLAAGTGALRRRGGDGHLAPVPRRPLPVRRRGRRGARHRAREPRAMKVGIVGMPNAGKSSLFNALTARRRRGRELPVHDDRAERRRRAGARPAARRGRGDGARVERRPGHDRLPRHRRARGRRAQGRGPGQPVPGQHPRDRRAAARRALPRRRERDPPRGRRRPGARHGDDRDRADVRRPRAGGAPPRTRGARGARRRPGGDRRGGVAARRDRGAPARRARPHGRRCPTAAPGAQRNLSPLTGKPVLYVANVDEGDGRRAVRRRRPRGRRRRGRRGRLVADRGRALRARRRRGRR